MIAGGTIGVIKLTGSHSGTSTAPTLPTTTTAVIPITVSAALHDWVQNFEQGYWSSCIADWNYANNTDDAQGGPEAVSNYAQVIDNDCSNLKGNSPDVSVNAAILKFTNDNFNWVIDAQTNNTNYFNDYKATQADLASLKNLFASILAGIVVQSVTTTSVSTGPTGVSGTNGASGNSGASGATGSSGVSGTSGATGTTGVATTTSPPASSIDTKVVSQPCSPHDWENLATSNSEIPQILTYQSCSLYNFTSFWEGNLLFITFHFVADAPSVFKSIALEKGFSTDISESGWFTLMSESANANCQIMTASAWDANFAPITVRCVGPVSPFTVRIDFEYGPGSEATKIAMTPVGF